MQQVVEGHQAGSGFEPDGVASLTVARAVPSTMPPVPVALDEATAEVPIFDTGGGLDDVPDLLAVASDQDIALGGAPDGPPPAGRVPRAVHPGLLVHVNAYKSDQTQVLSLWNSADPDGLLAWALEELADRGYLRGRTDEQLVSLAAALLVSVAAFEAAQAKHPGLDLYGVDVLLGALLDREPIPDAGEWEQALRDRALADCPDV